MRPLSPFTRALRGPLGKPSFPCPHHFPWRADLCLARSPRPKQKAAAPQKSDADGAASLPMIFERRCRPSREKGERPSLACGMQSLFHQARPFMTVAWKPHRCGTPKIPGSALAFRQWSPYLPSVQARVQSSTANPAIRPNSEMFPLTSVNPFDIQIAAIFRSFGPIVSPRISKPCRISP